MVLGALIPAAASAEPDYNIWGWAVVRNPGKAGYAIKGADRASRPTGKVGVIREGKGRHIVRFRGIKREAGNAQVTPLKALGVSCNVAGWSISDVVLEVYVSCFGRSGAPRDVPFVVSFMQTNSGNGRLAYLWANQESSEFYTPVLSYQYASNGGLIEIVSDSKGEYEVYLPNLASSDGNVQVTTYGHEHAAICRVAENGPDGGDLRVFVLCRSPNGLVQVDTKFTLVYTATGGLKGTAVKSWAWLFANRSAKKTYTPQFSSRAAKPAGKPRITRLGKGRYTVKLPSMPLGGAVQVTPSGTGRQRCHASAIRKTGKPQRIGVRCFTGDGAAPADSKFFLSYVK
jgi:hypothetical protein